MATWVTASWSTLGWVAVSTTAAYVVVVLYTRVTGLRSFAKMSAFDFAATIAIGSMAASMALLDSVTLAAGVVGLGTLFLLQAVVAVLRTRSDVFEGAVDNSPLLLMAGAEVLEDHLRLGNVSVGDLRGKLREAGVVRRDEVQVVVLETTGDISVLTGHDPVEPWLLEGVRGADRLDDQLLGRVDPESRV